MKYIISLNGKDYEVEVDKGEAMLVSVNDTPAPVAMAAPVAAPVAAAPAAAPAQAPAATVSGEAIPAPMPGTIVKIVASAGQSVKKGETLLILEAMKMENEITAPRDGVVGQMVVATGKSVATGDTLCTLN